MDAGGIMLIRLPFRFALTFSAVSLAGFFVAPAFATEWQQGGKPLAKATAVSIATAALGGEVLFEDTTAGFGVSCNVSGSGTAGPGAAGSITGLSTGPNCKLVKDDGGQCEANSESMNFKNTPPWATTLEESGGVIYDKIEKAAGGFEPQFEIICDQKGGGFIKKVCNAESTASMANVGGGEVSASFGGTITTCTGGDKGEINGTVYICPNMTVVK
jgi:hypothetical protein